MPTANAAEAALVPGARLYAVDHLLDAVGHLSGAQPLAPWPPDESRNVGQPTGGSRSGQRSDPSQAGSDDRRGWRSQSAHARATRQRQDPARRPATPPAAAPGMGRGLGSRRDRLRRRAASVRRQAAPAPVSRASSQRLRGGPGRRGYSAATRRGVPGPIGACCSWTNCRSFSALRLEALREPLEAGCIRIARAGGHVDFPARIQLVAAMNPCPCGYLGDGTDRCLCSPTQVERYRARISGRSAGSV